MRFPILLWVFTQFDPHRFAIKSHRLAIKYKEKMTVGTSHKKKVSQYMSFNKYVC